MGGSTARQTGGINVVPVTKSYLHARSGLCPRHQRALHDRGRSSSSGTTKSCCRLRDRGPITSSASEQLGLRAHARPLHRRLRVKERCGRRFIAGGGGCGSRRREGQLAGNGRSADHKILAWPRGGPNRSADDLRHDGQQPAHRADALGTRGDSRAAIQPGTLLQWLATRCVCEVDQLGFAGGALAGCRVPSSPQRLLGCATRQRSTPCSGAWKGSAVAPRPGREAWAYGRATRAGVRV
jgi:hypothetical protein